MESIDIKYNESTEDKNRNSWASLVESELGGSIDNKLLSSTNNGLNMNNKKNGENMLTIGEIIAIDYNKITTQEILEYQSIVTNNMKKYIKVCKERKDIFDTDLHLPKLEWLANTSKYLTDMNKLSYVDHKSKIMDDNNIPRSSYKFCEYNYECEFNYPNKKIRNVVNNRRGCYAQHFVHNFINADINSVINYIKLVNDKKLVLNYDELIKCMNTINFVINHMKDELENINCYHSKAENTNKSQKISKKQKKNKYNKKNNNM